MGRQITEMLKGTLDGIVLAILAAGGAYGYEITARLREMGFADTAEGTVYALLVRLEKRGLVDVEKVPSTLGPPRKVYSVNAAGQAYLEEFWATWHFLADLLHRLATDTATPTPSPDGPNTEALRTEEHSADPDVPRTGD